MGSSQELPLEGSQGVDQLVGGKVVPTTAKVEIQAVLATKIGFASHQNSVAVLRDIAVSNLGDITCTDLSLELVADPPFLMPKKWHIDRLDAGTTLQVSDRDVRLSAGFLNDLTEAVRGTITLRVTQAGQELSRFDTSVELLARHEWGGSGAMAELLAAFVLPNDPAVDGLLKAASDVLRRAGKPDAINGYESKDRKRVWSLVSALWSAVAGLKLSYALPPASFEQQGQKVRTPGTVLQGRLATCLDSAVLFAAAIEQMGLHPVVALLKGHAVVGFWLHAREFADVATDEAASLRKRIDLGELVFFETTLVAQAVPGDFQQAIGAATKLLDPSNDQNFIVAVDIRRARLQHIKPLPAAITQTSDDAADAPQEVAAFVEPPALPGFDEVPTLPKQQKETAADRIGVWQRKLLDLTSRNRLLNLPDGSNHVPLLCPDPSKLEDRMVDGKAVKLLPLPALDAGGRDSALYEQQNRSSLRDDVAREAFSRGELLTTLAPEKHESALTELYRKARTDLSEGGANTLFVALGFLKWRKSDNEDRYFRAPLVLLPVTLERKSARSGFTLRLHEDDTRFNLTLLELLRQDFALEIPGLSGPLPTDESGVDVNKIWNLVRHAVRDSRGFEVIPDIALATFSFAKYLMWKDLVDRASSLKENKVVRHLIERREQAYQPSGSFTPPEHLDTQIDPAKLFAPLPADSSQLSAVVASASGMDFVLDGPPGTGKSQTIANMIAHNLALGRRVLFVAEKMAALNVVHRRLTEKGLGPFCLQLHSNNATKTEVLAQLDSAWHAKERLTQEEWDREAAEVRRLRDDLNQHVALVHRRWPNGLTLHEAIGRTVLNTVELGAQFTWPPGTEHDAGQMTRMRAATERLGLNAHPVRALMAPLAGLERTDWSNAWQSEVTAAAHELIDTLKSLSEARDEVARATKLSLQTTTLEAYQQFVQLIRLACRAHGLDLSFAFAPDASSRMDYIRRALADLLAYRSDENQLSVPYKAEAARQVDAASASTAWNVAQRRFWPLSFFSKRAVVKQLRQHSESDAKPDPAKDLPILARMRTKLESLDVASPYMTGIPGWAALSSDSERLSTALDIGASLQKTIVAAATSPDDLVALRKDLSRLVIDANDLLVEAGPIDRACRALEQTLASARRAVEQFSQVAGARVPNITALAELAASVLTNQSQLNAWCSWCRARDEALSLGLHPLVAASQAGTASAADLLHHFEVGYARWFAGWAIDAEPRIRNFVAAEHVSKIEAFRKLDDQLSELSIRYIRSRLASEIPSKEAITPRDGYSVLRHQLQLQRRHKPIRQLIQDMGPAFSQLAPCMLMSPLSIAQYLPASQALFDLVIFDEASQIAPWDAIGAIARGKQLVVAGDHRQMPPTSFFARGVSSTDDDVEDDMESILDECKAAGLPHIGLTWHYRSRHESLIAFSNHRYYDGSLVTFPAAVTKASAVTWRMVPGVYSKGSARTNAIEAQEMVNEVVRRLRTPIPGQRPKTLAIVTLNSEQQGLVEDLLDKARRAHPEIEPHFSDATTEPVIVRNLETVQGDERDVIFLGIGYGPTELGSGSMSMNFGPLNREGGWRRLNVAITRARHEMVVFTSFNPSLIDLNRTSARAVRDLKHYIEFAEKGPRAIAEAVQGSVGGHESPFEKAVSEGLTRKGWHVVPQIGVSRFRIDLGIVHPDRPGDYLLGVECDGAMYHSAATARDRDKIRQGILNGLGWKLLRIWSTDWWVDRSNSLERLHREIDEELARHRAESSNQIDEPLTLDKDTIASGTAAAAHAAEPARIARNVANAATVSIPPVDPYRVADFTAFRDVISRERFEDPDYLPTLARLIGHVLSQEAPIAEDVLVTRIARIHGFQRAGDRIRERVLKVTKRNHQIRRDPSGGRFVWNAQQSPELWVRARAPADDAAVRGIDEIATEELLAAMSIVDAADIVSGVARYFGIKRVSATARSRIEKAVQRSASP